MLLVLFVVVIAVEREARLAPIIGAEEGLLAVTVLRAAEAAVGVVTVELRALTLIVAFEVLVFFFFNLRLPLTIVVAAAVAASVAFIS